MTNVRDILEKARASGQRLPDKDAAVLFAAAMRLASAQGATLRGRLVEIDESGALHLAPFDDQAPEEEPGYLAPELLAKDAPRKSEPRVQVYAAGALGYELLTGQQLSDSKVTGPALSGPLGDIIRMALAADRRERFGDLTQLYDAVEGVQPRLPPEAEKQQLAGIRQRAARWAGPGIEKEALAKLIEKLGHVEAQITQLEVQLSLSGKAWSRVDQTQRQALERLDRFENGLQRVEAQSRQKPSVALPIVATGLLGAAIGAAAVVFGPGPLHVKPAPVEEKPAPQMAAPVPPLPSPAPVPVVDAAIAETAKPVSAADDAGAIAAAPVDAGALAAVPDAGQIVAAAAPPQPPEPAPDPAPKRRRNPDATRAEMMHAVALSQVKRGEAALEHNRVDEALESFKAAIENEKSIAVAWRGMGMAYAMQGKDAQAQKAYEKYLQLAPSAADAAEIRASIAELKSRSKIGAGEEK